MLSNSRSLIIHHATSIVRFQSLDHPFAMRRGKWEVVAAGLLMVGAAASAVTVYENAGQGSCGDSVLELRTNHPTLCALVCSQGQAMVSVSYVVVTSCFLRFFHDVPLPFLIYFLLFHRLFFCLICLLQL